MLTELPLPPLTLAEAAHGARVAAEVAARIDSAGGWIPFSSFMETALYAPGLGYYVVPRALFGPDGDFVTAPELSPLFAACVANGVAGLLAQAGGGDVVEFGAGSGALAAELMPALLRLGAPVARYRIVEPSPALAGRQRERIAGEPALAACRDRLAAALAGGGVRQDRGLRLRRNFAAGDRQYPRGAPAVGVSRRRTRPASRFAQVCVHERKRRSRCRLRPGRLR